MKDLFVKIENFVKQPFNPNGDVLAWLLFVVFVVTIAVLWRQVLMQITE